MTSFEREMVYTVRDYWDGPRSGIADFKGRPHFFKCIFDDEADDWTERFWLHPIESETFQLALEDWEIWERWRDAFHSGAVSEESHFCLPEDRAKHESISLVLSELLRIDPTMDAQAQGIFEIVGPRNVLTSFRKWTVTWCENSNAAIQQALGAGLAMTVLLFIVAWASRASAALAGLGLRGWLFMKRIRSLVKYFGAAILCFLIGIFSFFLRSQREFWSAQIIVPEVNSFEPQGAPFEIGSSSFPESVMAGIQDSVSRNMPGYKLTRVYCTCPGIIASQVSYKNAVVYYGPNLVADIYIAEASSNAAATRWMKNRRKAGTDRLIMAPKMEADRDSGNGHSGTRIRIDRFIVEISGEVSVVEALSQMVLLKYPSS